MRHDESIYEKERREQSSSAFIFWALYLAAIVLCLFIFGWSVPSFFLLPLLTAIALSRWAMMQRVFENRMVLLAFQTHIGNLYVFDQNENDDTTLGRRDYAIRMLEESGNEHGVRVYSVLFRDVVVFCHWWEKGVLKFSREFRNDGNPATETWEQYIDFLNELRTQKENDFVKSRRKDSTGDEWLNEYYFKQKK